jgi:hypothetical protein
MHEAGLIPPANSQQREPLVPHSVSLILLESLELPQKLVFPSNSSHHFPSYRPLPKNLLLPPPPPKPPPPPNLLSSHRSFSSPTGSSLGRFKLGCGSWFGGVHFGCAPPSLHALLPSGQKPARKNLQIIGLRTCFFEQLGPSGQKPFS